MALRDRAEEQDHDEGNRHEIGLLVDPAEDLFDRADLAAQITASLLTPVPREAFFSANVGLFIT